MDKEEYYKRIEKINNRFKTDRVSVDEEYQLVCQRNYLSTKYIENLEQQCKKQKEVVNRAIEFTNKNWGTWCSNHCGYMTELQNILKEVSECNK